MDKSDRGDHPVSGDSADRQELHRLVDDLPVEQIEQAIHVLTELYGAGRTEAFHFDESALERCPQLRRVRRFVRENYGNDISLQTAAREAGLEQKYFSTFFRKKVGICFRTWVTLVRVSHAKGLVARGELTITQIAFASGFRDLRTFERAFKKCTGFTPRHMRRLASSALDHDS